MSASQPTVEKATSALVDLEQDLDQIKAEAVQARKRILDLAVELSAQAKSEVLADTRVMADEKLAAAKVEAEKEALLILAKGDESLKVLKGRISSKKEDATELVVSRLLSR